VQVQRAQWLPSLNQEVLEPRLVESDIAMESTSERTKSVDYKSLFKPGTDGKPAQNVLVIGEAGVGKSKFCEKLKLLSEWGEEAVLNEYSLVFFVPLWRRSCLQSHYMICFIVAVQGLKVFLSSLEKAASLNSFWMVGTNCPMSCTHSS